MKKDSDSISCRSRWLIAVSALGQYAMLTSQSWKIIVKPENFPNAVEVWFLWIMMPLHFLPYPLRALRIHLKYHLALTDVDNDVIKLLQERQQEREKQKILQEEQNRNREDDERNESSSQLNESLIDIDDTIYNTNSAHHQNTDPRDLANLQRGKKIFDFLRAHPRLMSDEAFLCYNFAIMFIFLCIAIYRQLHYPENNIHERGGGVTNNSYKTMIVILTCAEIFVWYSVYKLRVIHDKLQVNTELIIIAILWLVFLIPYIVTGWISIDTVGIISKRIPPIFNICLCYCSFLVSFGMPVHMAVVKPTQSVKVDLKNVDEMLDDEEASQLLLEYSFKKLCPQNVLFLIEIRKYMSIKDSAQFPREFERIRKTYIENNTQYHINISGKMVDTILNMDSSQASSASFQLPYKEVQRLVISDIIPYFFETPEYREFQRRRRAQYAPVD